MAKLENRHYEYLKDNEFKERYKDILNTRLVYSNNKIEEDALPIGKLYDNAHIDSLSDNLDAFEILLKKINYIYSLRNNFLNEKDIIKKRDIAHELRDSTKLTQELIIKVANTINKHALYISQNYRKIGNNVKFDDKYSIESSNNIENAMKKLLDNYYGAWKDLDIFEREARFNIEFLRIHPFEDGNGRTSRLILNYNLLIQGHAPVLMPEDVRGEYFNARNNEDVNYIKDLFEKESKKELAVLDRLIERYEEKNERKLSNE